MLPRASHMMAFAGHAIGGAFAFAIFAFSAMAFDADGQEARLLHTAYEVVSGERDVRTTVCGEQDISACVDLPVVEVAELRAELRERLS